MSNLNQGKRESSDTFDIIDIVRLRCTNESMEDEEEGANLASSAIAFNETSVEPSPDSEGESLDASRMSRSEPGAFSGAPGRRFSQLPQLRFSLVGATVRSLQSRVSLRSLQPPEDAAGMDPPLERRRNSSSDLSLALPIEDESSLQFATPLDMEESQRRRSTRTRQLNRTMLLMVLLGCIIVAIILALVFGLLNKQEHSFATLVPSTAPSEDSSSDNLLQDLSISTVNSIFKSGTPQEMAYVWLSKHHNTSALPQWKQRQLFALSTFYFAFQGPHWFNGRKIDWLDDDKDECNWLSGMYGDFCIDQTYHEPFIHPGDPCYTHGVFRALSLRCLKLAGLSPSMPPEIALLTALAILELAQSDIDAPLSHILPSDLFQLTSLVDIRVSDNSLTGPIPTELGVLSGLEFLSLNNNSLTGPIPTSFGSLSSLIRLYLDENSFSGHLPPQIATLSSLWELHLQNNSLSGPIHTELGTLSNLKVLRLGHNFFSGTIPTEVGMLSALWELDLSQNSLSGPIPSELGMLTGLRELRLNSNSLSGPLPSELALLTSLHDIYWYDNSFSGPVPGELEALPIGALDPYNRSQ